MAVLTVTMGTVAGAAVLTITRTSRHALTIAVAGIATVTPSTHPHHALLVNVAGTSSVTLVRDAIRPRSIAAAGAAGVTVAIHARRGLVVTVHGTSTAEASVGVTRLTQLGLEVISLVLPLGYLVLTTPDGATSLVVPIVPTQSTMTPTDTADRARAKDGTQRAVYIASPVAATPGSVHHRVWSVTTDYMLPADSATLIALLDTYPILFASGDWIRTTVATWTASGRSTSINGPGGSYDTVTFTLTEA